ncbi:MAG: serine hydrolase [Chitinophaga sp.]|jgi:Beta-lactamase|nr:serine hydrolase [Chitinophaga sp.]
MKRLLFWSSILFINFSFAQKPTSYFPAADNWQHKSLVSFDIDSLKIADAIQFAKANEAKLPRNQELAQAMTFGKEPYSDPVGPLEERGDPSGIIVYKGYIIAQWGDVDKVDMTNSVTKSILSTVVGLAVDKVLIKSVNDKVYPYVPPIEVFNNNAYRSAEDMGKQQLLYPFSSEHNKKITWDDMLRQVSDWEGTLWGKPDWADRPNDKPNEWLTRKRNEPGSFWKYNDTRVNALALATTTVWRKPLPEVLRENIMNPIGASNTWHWTGYRNSWIVLDGKLIQSVSGGGHFGGGLFINAYDMARFGLLTLHKGNWNGKQLISEQWINQSTTPTKANTGYGYMNYFLNTDKKMLPSAPATAFQHIGNGTNIIYVDREHDIVAVVRWIENNAMDGFVKRMLEAFEKK